MIKLPSRAPLKNRNHERHEFYVDRRRKKHISRALFYDSLPDVHKCRMVNPRKNTARKLTTYISPEAEALWQLQISAERVDNDLDIGNYTLD